MRPLVALLFPLMSIAADYSAQKAVVDGIEVVRLAHAAHNTEVAIAPSLGNLAYEFKVNGKNVLWLPYQTLAELKAKPQFGGIPFLAPWANRLSEDAFFANGKNTGSIPIWATSTATRTSTPFTACSQFRPTGL